jgi:hypothetical protein
MSEVRLTSAAHDVAETYVTTQGFYAAIYDEASPVNVKGFMEREFEASRQQIHALGTDPGFICLPSTGGSWTALTEANFLLGHSCSMAFSVRLSRLQGRLRLTRAELR